MNENNVTIRFGRVTAGAAPGLTEYFGTTRLHTLRDTPGHLTESGPLFRPGNWSHVEPPARTDTQSRPHTPRSPQH
jgi:hypothetical protein